MATADTEYEAFIKARESEAAELERRAAAIRAVVAQLRELASGGVTAALPTPAAPSVPAVGRQPASSLTGLTLADAAQQILADEGGPLHVREIVDRMRARGIVLPPDKEQGRRNVVGAMGRRKDVFRLLGKGRYALGGGAARAGGRPSGKGQDVGRQDGPAPRRSVSARVLDVVTREQGLTSTEVAERIIPTLVTNSGNPRKLVLTVISYLTRDRILKDADGRLYPKESDAQQDALPFAAAENDNGRAPDLLALDR